MTMRGTSYISGALLLLMTSLAVPMAEARDNPPRHVSRSRQAAMESIEKATTEAQSQLDDLKKEESSILQEKQTQDQEDTKLNSEQQTRDTARNQLVQQAQQFMQDVDAIKRDKATLEAEDRALAPYCTADNKCCGGLQEPQYSSCMAQMNTYNTHLNTFRTSAAQIEATARSIDQENQRLMREEAAAKAVRERLERDRKEWERRRKDWEERFQKATKRLSDTQACTSGSTNVLHQKRCLDHLFDGSDPNAALYDPGPSDSSTVDARGVQRLTPEQRARELSKPGHQYPSTFRRKPTPPPPPPNSTGP